MENNFGSLKVKNMIKCEPDGSLTQTEYPSMSGLSANMKIQTVSYEGAAFPAPTKWVVGSSWTNSFKVKISIAMGEQTIIQSGTMKINSKIVAQETVNVPAGTFTALKVTQTIAQDMLMSIGGKITPVKNTISTTSWYAKNVGLI